MKKLLKYISFVSLAAFYPMIASAGTIPLCPLGANPQFLDLSVFVVCNINKGVIPLIFALALVMFVWGVTQYVINSSDEAKKEKGRQFMLWGIIALTVMVGVWGLVHIFGATFGIDYAIPHVKTP